MPQRIIKPAPLTLDEIKAGLIETGNEIDSARAKFQADNSNLDGFYSERTALKAEIVELQGKLAEKQARLNELESAGTPKDSYASALVSAERQVMGWGSSLLATLSDQAARRIYGIGFDELSKDSQRDVSARYRRDLGRFQSNFYTRLGRTYQQAPVEQVEQRAVEMLEDLSSLLDSEFLTKEN
jgi:hypothetical protein